jgi:hypothetical protein
MKSFIAFALVFLSCVVTLLVLAGCFLIAWRWTDIQTERALKVERWRMDNELTREAARRRRWYSYLTAMGIVARREGISLHHGAASQMIQSGSDPELVEEIVDSGLTYDELFEIEHLFR